MTECEVCLRPFDGAPTVAAITYEEHSVRVVFCRDCITSVFQTMANRWHEGIAENNAAVAEFIEQITGRPYAPGGGR